MAVGGGGGVSVAPAVAVGGMVGGGVGMAWHADNASVVNNQMAFLVIFMQIL